jgi:ribonuclease Z
MRSKLLFYGTSAAPPSPRRGFSCIGLIGGDSSVTLFDCGDGSVNKILSAGTDVLSISRIFITHFHSDHLSGLTQIVETMGIRKRRNNLDVYGPKGLMDYFSTVEKITRVASNREFQIKLHELAPNNNESFDQISISAFEMTHTIPCIGYRIDAGDFVLAYTGDTEPCEKSIELGANSDYFIHEATFLQREENLARKSKHSTASEAGRSARKANARNLILTHVNDDHETEQEMLREVRSIFENTKVAHDGLELVLSV